MDGRRRWYPARTTSVVGEGRAGQPVDGEGWFFVYVLGVCGCFVYGDVWCGSLG